MSGMYLAKYGTLNTITITTLEVKDLKRDDRINCDLFTEISEIYYLFCHMVGVD